MPRRKGKGALALAMVPLMPQGYTVDRTGGLPQGVKDANGSIYVDAEHRVIHAPGGVKMSREDLAHEVGHLFRFNSGMTQQDLDRFARIAHVPSDPPGPGLNPKEEWFADFYAAAATGHEPWKVQRVRGGGLRGGNDMTYATITPRRMRRFRALLERIGERENLAFGPVGRPRPGMTGANAIEMVG